MKIADAIKNFFNRKPDPPLQSVVDKFKAFTTKPTPTPTKQPERVPMPPMSRQPTQAPKPTPTPTPYPLGTAKKKYDFSGLYPHENFSPKKVLGAISSTPKKYVKTIEKASKKYNVPANIISAMLQHESMNWNPNVIKGNINSPKGAQGVAQFMPNTVTDLVRRGFGDFDPTNPEEAIPAAAFYLDSLSKELKDFHPKDWYEVLKAYNAGPGNYRKHDGDLSDFPETVNYVKSISGLIDEQSKENPWEDIDNILSEVERDELKKEN